MISFLDPLKMIVQNWLWVL